MNRTDWTPEARIADGPNETATLDYIRVPSIRAHRVLSEGAAREFLARGCRADSLAGGLARLGIRAVPHGKQPGACLCPEQTIGSQQRGSCNFPGMFLLAVGADTAIYGADRFLGYDLDEETPDLRVRLREDPEAVEAIVTAVVTGREFRGHARPYHHGRAGVAFDDEIELPGGEVAGAAPDHLRWILGRRPALPASPDECLKFLSARGHGILLGRTEP